MEDFTTSRLQVQDWTPHLSDPEGAAALAGSLGRMLTPPVLAHLPEPLHLPAKDPDIPGWIAARAAKGDVSTIREARGGALVGLLFLTPEMQTPTGAVRHLGYLFAQSAWGRGYATEAVLGLIRALEGQGALTLVAGVAEGNAASVRVLAKAGFTPSTERSEAGIDTFIRELR